MTPLNPNHLHIVNPDDTKETDSSPLSAATAATVTVSASDTDLLGAWRTQSTTIALLKQAYDQIETAERRMAEYESRIRQLEDLAETDPLTGLMNRRGFERLFEQELSRIRRHQSPGALFVLIDLDRFKPLNDLYGHQAGDACLRLVAEHLMKSIRLADGAARFGGDEFALLLTNADPERALVRVQQVRETLNTMHLTWEGDDLCFGASIGSEPVVATSTYDTAYQTTDRALYVDKKARKAQR